MTNLIVGATLTILSVQLSTNTQRGPGKPPLATGTNRVAVMKEFNRTNTIQVVRTNFVLGVVKDGKQIPLLTATVK